MMFTMVFGLIMVVMIVIMVVILLRAARGISTWNKNNHSPCLTVSAVVVSRRTEVSHHCHTNASPWWDDHHPVNVIDYLWPELFFCNNPRLVSIIRSLCEI